MVKLCNKYPFAACEHKTFSDVDELEKYNGIWASATLIHLSPEEFEDAILKLCFALKEGGILYFSLKASADEKNEKDTRKFFYHEQSRVLEMLSKLSMEQLEIWENEGRKQGQTSKFVNYLFKKSSAIKSPEARRD